MWLALFAMYGIRWTFFDGLPWDHQTDFRLLTHGGLVLVGFLAVTFGAAGFVADWRQPRRSFPMIVAIILGLLFLLFFTLDSARHAPGEQNRLRAQRLADWGPWLAPLLVVVAFVVYDACTVRFKRRAIGTETPDANMELEGCGTVRAGPMARLASEFVRLSVITIVSPLIGFGTLYFLGSSLRVIPSSMDKETLCLLGFVVATGAGWILLKLWPTQNRK